MMRPRNRWPRVTSAVVAAGLAFGAAPALAEDAPEDDISARVKQQMERIIELMRENEGALLKLSAGQDARTRAVEVEVPPGTEPPSGGSGSTGEGATGGRGTEVERALEEILGGQREGAKQIPGELEELVKMIPT